MRRCIAFAAFAVVALLRVVDSQAQVGEAVTPQSPPPRLKPSPILEPPASKPLTPQPAAADHDAIFLRADRLEGEGQVVFRYTTRDGRLDDAANANGSCRAIAGICNPARNVVGLMPHPERASEPELGSADGRQVFEALARVLSPAAR